MLIAPYYLELRGVLAVPHHLELRGVGIIVGQGWRFKQCEMSFLKEWTRKN
jgi:uncharacterized ferritin-like protein (DUF455 family)